MKNKIELYKKKDIFTLKTMIKNNPCLDIESVLDFCEYKLQNPDLLTHLINKNIVSLVVKEVR